MEMIKAKENALFLAKNLRTKYNYEPGSVKVLVSRAGEKTIDFFTPEWITDQPYRTDRLIYCFSSEFYNFQKDIFGTLPPVYSTEYALDQHDAKTVYVRKNNPTKAEL